MQRTTASEALRAAIVSIKSAGFEAHLDYWKVVFEVGGYQFARGGNTKFIALRNAAREFQFLVGDRVAWELSHP